jgi:hypothetical protein
MALASQLTSYYGQLLHYTTLYTNPNFAVNAVDNNTAIVTTATNHNFSEYLEWCRKNNPKHSNDCRCDECHV